ncbi:MAG: SpoIIE family protein phosphatase [Bacteroidales bacterium]|nr:SpoIIE family protein phosphatase [Bacteroidales bacterium]
MTTYILISVIAILTIWVVYLLIARNRIVRRATDRVRSRCEKEISDQAYEIKRLNYLYQELRDASSSSMLKGGSQQAGGEHQAQASGPLKSAEEIMLEQKRLAAEKEDMAVRNRKLWDMSIQIQKDRQRIQLLKNELELKHKNVTDSIIYAKRIQDAVLPRVDILTGAFDDHFLFWLPKETVSGDFYWMKRDGNMVAFCVADCTGHGVPGAFMSMMGVTFLNEICAHITRDTMPSDILEQLRQLVIDTLKQDNSNPLEPKDGMDLAFCILDLDTRMLRFSGANNPLYLVRNCELTEYKAQRCPIGLYPKLKPFETTDIQTQPGDYLYMFSDGFADQFNGKTGKKVTYGRFRNLLCDINKETSESAAQQDRLNKFLLEWRADFIQMDDVLVGGFRIK